MYVCVCVLSIVFLSTYARVQLQLYSGVHTHHGIHPRWADSVMAQLSHVHSRLLTSTAQGLEPVSTRDFGVCQCVYCLD